MMAEKWGESTRLWQLKNGEKRFIQDSLQNDLEHLMVENWGASTRLWQLQTGESFLAFFSLWNRLGECYRRYNLLLNRSVDPVEKRSFFICCFRTGILLNTNPVFDGE